MASKNTVKLSLPAAQTVRGYEIKRMPLGPMLEAIETLRELPGELLKTCFPSMDAGQILQQLKSFDADMLITAFGNALTIAPTHTIKVFAGLCGVPEEAFLTDANIGFDGLMEMVNAWIEVNGIENFIKAVRPLVEKIRAAAGSFRKQNSGSSV